MLEMTLAILPAHFLDMLPSVALEMTARACEVSSSVFPFSENVSRTCWKKKTVLKPAHFLDTLPLVELEMTARSPK